MKSKNKDRHKDRPLVIPRIKPRNPLVIPPNQRHEDKRKKEKHKDKDKEIDQ